MLWANFFSGRMFTYIFTTFTQFTLETTEFREITQNKGHIAI